jgi:molybdate transport system substrate-binding protein
VFASAAPANMTQVVKAGPSNFARNKMEVAVPATRQPDVTSVLSQVELGNVDAGMVYVTDVKAARSKVKGIAVPSGDNASTLYPIATLKDATDKTVANEFVGYVMGPQGEHVLSMDGFEKP